MKKCTCCKQDKPIQEFYNNKSSYDGKTHWCKKCYTQYRETHRIYNREYMSNRRNNFRDEINENKRVAWRNNDPRKKMLSQARNRAKRLGIPINISLDDIIIPEVCPLLGVKFVPGVKGNYSLTPSLDRIDPCKGYIKGNIWVISMKANTMKSNACKEELRLFATNILQYFKDNDIVQTSMKVEELQDKEPVG